MARIVLLGPQRLRPTIRQVVTELGIAGPIAAVTAGWQEREQEDDELAEHMQEETCNLELHRRGEEVLADDPQLFAALQELREERREAQRLYRVSLEHALSGVRALAGEAETPLAVEELAEAFEIVRALDARHLERITRLETAFRKHWGTGRRRSVRRQRHEIDRILERCQVLAIAGGHVGVLVDTLRLFGLDERLRRHAVLAWSAGAMAIGPRVILFHDSPPQGFGNAEVWGPGLGLYARYLLFPHAKTRLHVGDRLRISILARRFLPQICVPMDEGELLTLTVGRATGGSSARRMQRDGTITELEP